MNILLPKIRSIGVAAVVFICAMQAAAQVLEPGESHNDGNLDAESGCSLQRGPALRGDQRSAECRTTGRRVTGVYMLWRQTEWRATAEWREAGISGGCR